MDFEKLTKPFPESAIKERPQALKGPDGKKMPKGSRTPYPEGCTALLVAYVDARDVENRLDDVAGAGGWKDSYEIVGPKCAKCSLSLWLGTEDDGEWVTKEGVGYSNSPGTDDEDEPLKAAESDSLKRAAVKWGIGRHLYDRPIEGYVAIDKWGKRTKKGGKAAPKADACITKAQAVQLRAEVKGHGFTGPDLNKWVKDEYGLDPDADGKVDMCQLTTKQMGATIAAMEKAAKDKKQTKPKAETPPEDDPEIPF